MAKRRMFSLDIVDSDAFLEMPLSTQTLYFHLGMRADDDGFVSSPKRIQRMIGASDDDLKLLVAKRFILTFDSGIVVIKHWKINNYIRNDRYNHTQYLEEKKTLYVKENGAYTDDGIPNDNQTVYQMDTQVRLGKVRLGYKSHTHYITLGELQNVNLYEDEKEKLIVLYGKQVVDDYIERLSINKAKTGKEYESDYAVLMEWLRKDKVDYI
jgi:hypothetical protein